MGISNFGNFVHFSMLFNGNFEFQEFRISGILFIFSIFLCYSIGISNFRNFVHFLHFPIWLKFKPWGLHSCLKAQITYSGLKPKPQASDPSLKGQIIHGAQITASRHKFLPQHSNPSLEAHPSTKAKIPIKNLAKHRSSAPSGPLPLSPSHFHIYSH